MLTPLLAALLQIAAPAPEAATPAPLPSPTPTASPLPRVALETSLGRIVVEIEDQRAPITAANFLRYVTARRLDGIAFYRTVKVQPGFGFVQFGVQNDPKRVFPAIRHEPTTATGVKHLDGTLSIARFAPGTAQGDFTISVGDQPSLDADPSAPGDNQGFAAFGRVVEGMDVVLRVLDAATDPAKGEGYLKGQYLAQPVRIVSARRLP